MHLIFLETSRGKPGDASYLTSPPLNVYRNFKSFRSMSFYYHKHGETTGTLRVEASVNATWTTIWTHTGETHAHQHADWSHGQAPLSPFTTQVRFMGTRETSDTGDISVDKVHFSNAAFVQPQCACENGQPAVSGACVEQGASICRSCNRGLVLTESKTVCAVRGQCTFETVKMCGWNARGGAGRWIRVQTSPSLETGAYRAHNGNYFMLFDAQRRSTDGPPALFYRSDEKSYLTSPPIAPGMKSMSFHYLMFGATMGTVSVEARHPIANGTLIWSTIWTLSASLHTRPAWLHGEAALPASTTGVRFVGCRGEVSPRAGSAAPMYGIFGDMSVDTVSFSRVDAVQPVCTCLGGTAATGVACVLEGAAICQRCDSGLVPSEDRLSCVPSGSCTFDGPRGSSLCGWKDGASGGSTMQWTRVVL
eukprot:COSAG01_NODE_16166_length_1263_cov_2.068729_1_plen_420_part_11